MSFFESIVALLSIAILLLQLARRTKAPYPAMLAGAGVVLALSPQAPRIHLDPHTALPLFIAPVLVDAAFDFPLAALKRYGRPLIALVVVAVLLTAAAVTTAGVLLAGLPFWAALALGAIVAPPDAAAATAVLSQVSMPRRSVTVLKGESLLNDASALLLFGLATSARSHGAIDALLALKIVLAVPGGIVFGIVVGRVFRWFTPHLHGTLGGNLLDLVSTLAVWLVAERLGLSPILCLVAFAMTIARTASLSTPPRARIHSYAVWDTAVFLLNVLAFLLMGLQARTIVADMSSDRLAQAAWFSAVVVACVIGIRMAWLVIYNRLAARYRFMRGQLEPAPFKQAVLIGWCGMRGLVTLATAFALPATFPQRDLIVLCAFAIVLATLVLQGLTLAPLVRALGLSCDTDLPAELARTRAAMAKAALEDFADEHGPAADHWRFALETRHAAASPSTPCVKLAQWRALGLSTTRRQRTRLEELCLAQEVGPDAFLIIQEELDFAEVALGDDRERHIEEN